MKKSKHTLHTKIPTDTIIIAGKPIHIGTGDIPITPGVSSRELLKRLDRAIKEGVFTKTSQTASV